MFLLISGGEIADEQPAQQVGGLDYLRWHAGCKCTRRASDRRGRTVVLAKKSGPRILAHPVLP